MVLNSGIISLFPSFFSPLVGSKFLIQVFKFFGKTLNFKIFNLIELFFFLTKEKLNSPTQHTPSCPGRAWLQLGTSFDKLPHVIYFFLQDKKKFHFWGGDVTLAIRQDCIYYFYIMASCPVLLLFYYNTFIILQLCHASFK